MIVVWQLKFSIFFSKFFYFQDTQYGCHLCHVCCCICFCILCLNLNYFPAQILNNNLKKYMPTYICSTEINIRIFYITFVQKWHFRLNSSKLFFSLLETWLEAKKEFYLHFATFLSKWFARHKIVQKEFTRDDATECNCNLQEK